MEDIWDGRTMINFYTLPQVQKYLKKGTDEQYQFTNMKIYKHFGLIAKTGGGKTNAVMNYLKLTSQGKGTFDHIFFCYQTDEELYDYLKDINKKQKQITFIKGVSNFPDVSEFPDQVSNEKEKKFLVVFDDCLNEISKPNIKKIEDYFKLGRKRGITLTFLGQRYYDVSKFVRAQLSYTLIANMGMKDAVAILKDSGADMSKEKLMKIFKYATRKESDKDMPFMKICNINCPAGEKFARNYTDFIDVNDPMFN